jgi:serine/threonine protein kinase
MEILKSAECFKKVDDTYVFNYLQLIVQENCQLYLAKCNSRKPNLHNLYSMEKLETEDRGPVLKHTWTVLGSPLDYFVKVPDLWAYNNPGLEQQIQQEVEMCEFLKLYPHPNIALFSGCEITNGRVSGICFTRYTSTLQEKANPRHLCKAEFQSSSRLLVDDTIKSSVEGIAAAIHHLHSLGITHNDITPSNIMFKEDGTAVLIDFGSCRKIGEPLNGAKRTYG